MPMFVIMVVVTALYGVPTPSLHFVTAPDQAACENMAELLNQQYSASRDISATARCLSALPAGTAHYGAGVPSDGIANILGRPKPVEDAYGPQQQKGANQ